MPSASTAETRPSTFTLVRSAAAASTAPAATAKTTPTAVTESSTPARSGPTSVPTLSIVEVAPFDAISSCGVRASDGSSAWSVGLIRVEEGLREPRPGVWELHLRRG